MAGAGKDALAYFPDDVVAGRYRITGVLGRGGFAAVYAAEHLGTEQPVAIKMLSVALQDGSNRAEANAIDRFQREARTTAKLQHPNTVRVFDVGQDGDGALFLAMELLRGPTLEAALATLATQQRTLTEAEGIEVVVGVLRSLGEAHAAGLVHRDLKPANVMLAEVPGCPPVVKVLDFGCTHTAGSTLTRDGLIMGTPGYMSPEQCRGQEVDARSDLYSVAVMLYRCVTGHPPFPDTDAMTLLFRTAHEAVPDPDAGLARPLTPAFRRVLLQALAKEPADRPASADEFRRSLDDVRRMLPRSELAGTDGESGLLLSGIVRAVGDARPAAVRGPSTAVQPRTDAYAAYAAYAAAEPAPAEATAASAAATSQGAATAVLAGPTVVARPHSRGPSGAVAPLDVAVPGLAIPRIVRTSAVVAAPGLRAAGSAQVPDDSVPPASGSASPGQPGPTVPALDAAEPPFASAGVAGPARPAAARRHVWWVIGAAAAVGVGLLLGAVLRGPVQQPAGRPPPDESPATSPAPERPHPLLDGAAVAPRPAPTAPTVAANAEPVAGAATVPVPPAPAAGSAGSGAAEHPASTPDGAGSARGKPVPPAPRGPRAPGGAERRRTDKLQGAGRRLLQPRLME